MKALIISTLKLINQTSLRALVVVVSLGLGTEATAQQQSLYTQYNQNNFLVMPALAGQHFGGDLRVGSRQLYNSAIDLPPANYYLTANYSFRQHEGPLTVGAMLRGKNGDKTLEARRKAMQQDRGYKTHHGVGVQVVVDQIGLWRTLTAQAVYAWHYAISSNLQLSAGGGFGFNNHSLMTDRLRLENMNDRVFAGPGQVTVPNASVGLWLAGKRFYAGLSAQQLIPVRYSFMPDAFTTNGSADQLHTYLTGGYKFDLVNDIVLVPSAMVRMVQGASLNADLNLTARYRDQIWFGTSYRAGGQSLAVMAGLNLGTSFMVGYSYDHNLDGRIMRSFGTHEIVLGYRLTSEKARAFAPNDLWQ